jgi:transcriptional regulator with XRE-family HTH domain
LKNSLKRILEAKRIKLKPFTEAIGVNYNTAYGYYSGDRPMTPDFLQKAAKYLQTTEEELLKDPEEMKEPATAYRNPALQKMRDQLLVEELREHVKELAGTEPGQRRPLLAALQEIVKELLLREEEKEQAMREILRTEGDQEEEDGQRSIEQKRGSARPGVPGRGPGPHTAPGRGAGGGRGGQG